MDKKQVQVYACCSIKYKWPVNEDDVAFYWRRFLTRYCCLGTAGMFLHS